MSNVKLKEELAFPTSFNCDYPNEIVGGMALRDYFAAKALQGLLCSPEKELHNQWPTHKDRAEFAYEQADAMLEARKV